MVDVRPRPPERIDLGDVVLRHYTEADAPGLAAAAAASIDHLSPWMPWATQDGVTAQAMATFIAETNGRAAEGSEAVYGLFDPTDGRCRGGCGLHDRLAPGGIEIGYWLAAEATGRGLMARTVAALTDLALAMDDITWVEVHCDEANDRSAGVPRRLGYELTRFTGPLKPLVARVEGEWRFGPADAGTTETWSWTLHPSSALTAPVVALLARMWPAHARQTLDELAPVLDG